MRDDPILVIGMHRSGTELVTRALADCGVFMGASLDKHFESKFFQSLNRWMLEKHGARWDAPAAFDYVLREPRIRIELSEYLSLRLRSVQALEYFGPPRALRGWGGLGAWGWKDPRTTLTLPVWLDVMPRARVLNVVRHGVDVASSLMVRERENFARRSSHHDRVVHSPRRYLYAIYAKRSPFSMSPRCLDLEGGLSLWEDYLDRADGHARTWGDRVLTIRYEDLLASPVPHLQRIASFCNLVPSKETIDAIAARADPRRAFAFRQSAELRAFAELTHERLRARGYG